MSLKAPWTQAQVDNLNSWQECGYVHPFTCGGTKDGKDCRADLVATIDGWICPEGCGYTQDWAHAQLANHKASAPKEIADLLKANNEGKSKN